MKIWKTIVDFFSTRHYLFLLLIYPIFSIWYFVLQQFPLSYHLVECPLDRMLPFIEWFIIPYVVWYVYIAGALTVFAFRSRAEFLHLVMFLYIGMGLSLLIQTIYPTAIAFRPESFNRDNVFIRLVELIYANDTPTNVFPSIHCYNAIVTHITISKFVKDRKGIKAASLLLAVLICLSTVFIKQHSVLDAAGAMILVAVIYPLVYCVRWPFFRGERANGAVNGTKG